jgi:hypothetical protein
MFELVNGTKMTFPDGTATPPKNLGATIPEKFVGATAKNWFV